MLLSSSYTKRTLMHLFLFTNTTQRELVLICTQRIRNASSFRKKSRFLSRIGGHRAIRHLMTPNFVQAPFDSKDLDKRLKFCMQPPLWLCTRITKKIQEPRSLTFNKNQDFDEKPKMSSTRCNSPINLKYLQSAHIGSHHQ